MPWLDWLIAAPCPLCQRSSHQRLGQGTGQGTSQEMGNPCFCAACSEQVQENCAPAWHHLPLTEEPSAPTFPVYTWGPYQGSLRRALSQLKYEGQAPIGETLGRWLAQPWCSERSTHLVSSQDVSRQGIVPIPLHPERQATRGYNQAAVISQAFCRVSGDRHLPLLTRSRPTAPQHGLDVAGRQANVDAAFSLPAATPLRPDLPLWLLDDIATTGATLLAARAVLVERGYQVAGAIAMARAANFGPPPKPEKPRRRS